VGVGVQEHITDNGWGWEYKNTLQIIQQEEKFGNSNKETA